MRFTIHTGLEMSPFVLRHGKQTENRTNIYNQKKQNLPVRRDNLEYFSAAEKDTNICGRNEK